MGALYSPVYIRTSGDVGRIGTCRKRDDLNYILFYFILPIVRLFRGNACSPIDVIPVPKEDAPPVYTRATQEPRDGGAPPAKTRVTQEPRGDETPHV